MTPHTTSPCVPVADTRAATQISDAQTFNASVTEARAVTKNVTIASQAMLAPVLDFMTGSSVVTHPLRCFPRNFSRLAYAQGFTSWLYRDEGTSIDDIEVPGFFDSVVGIVTHGDAIMIRCIEGVAHRWLDTRGGPIVTRGCV